MYCQIHHYRMFHYLIITFYLGHTGIGAYFRSSGQTWKLSGMLFIPGVCQGASLYHVALICLLRCFVLARPLTFESWHQKFTKRWFVGVWIFMVIILLIPNIICTKGFTTLEFPQDYLDMYIMAWKAALHLTLTLPIGLILVFYVFQLYFLKPCAKKVEQSNMVIKQKKSMERMIHMITISTILRYVPYVAWMQYNLRMINENRANEVYDGTGEVCMIFYKLSGFTRRA